MKKPRLVGWKKKINSATSILDVLVPSLEKEEGKLFKITRFRKKRQNSSYW
jgi:hypothetical protein